MGNKSIKRVKTEGFPLKDDKEQLNTIEIYNKLSLEEKEKKEEDKNIKIVKKHNKENEDGKLIDECLSKHFFFFFFFNLDRNYIIYI